MAHGRQSPPCMLEEVGQQPIASVHVLVRKRASNKSHRESWGKRGWACPPPFLPIGCFTLRARRLACAPTCKCHQCPPQSQHVKSDSTASLVNEQLLLTANRDIQGALRPEIPCDPTHLSVCRPQPSPFRYSDIGPLFLDHN